MSYITEDFLSFDITSLSKAIQEKKVSSVEVTKKVLEEISSRNSELNAYITVTSEEAIKQASKADKEIMEGINKGPLHGVPIALKDNILTKGIKTTIGSEIYKDNIPEYNATVVEKLVDAGAVILGKLNTHQFAYGTTGDRSYFGPMRNPFNPTKIVGGSSGGSAAAVATSLSFASLGTDTGGSIRIPASFAGIVGMKPTFGRVSKHGVYPLCWTLDHIGPMTKTVRDNAIMLEVLAGYDEKDPYSVKKGNVNFTAYLNVDIKGKVIGIPSGNFFTAIDEEINESYCDAIKVFKDLGATIVEIELPDMEKMTEEFWMILKSEAYAFHKKRLEEYPEQWDEEVKGRLLTGLDSNASDLINALHYKEIVIRKFHKIFKSVDVILTPTVPILPTNIEQREVCVNGENVHVSKLLNRFTGPTNLTGLPSLSIPSGVSNTGLPIGIQIISNLFEEGTIYSLASAFENFKNAQDTKD